MKDSGGGAPIAVSAALAAFLALWGLSWGLPDEARVRRVLPGETLTPAFAAKLAATWRERQAAIGSDPLKRESGWQDLGFEGEAVVEPGWTEPPELLLNSSRSFFVRSAFEDESNVLMGLARIKPHRLEFNPKLYTAYGTAYFLALGGWMAGVAAATPFRLVRDLSFYVADLDQMAWLYLSGRFFAAFLHALTAALVALIGCRFWGRTAGLWAGLFYAAAPANVLLSHIMKPGSLGVAAVCGMFYCCLALAETDDSPRRLWRRAGLLLGLAAGATNLRWDAGFLLAATAWLKRGPGLKPRGEDLAGFLEAVGLAVAVFFLTNPFFILEASTAWPMMLTSPGHASRDPLEIWRLLTSGLPKGLGPGAAFWMAAGFLAGLVPARPKHRLLLAAFALFAATAIVVQDARLMIHLRHFGGMPFACLLAGLGVAALSEAAGAVGLAARGAAGLALAWSLFLSGVLDYNFTRERPGLSTKDEAGAWIEANLPAGAELGMIKLPQPGNSAYFQWNRYRLRFVDSRGFSALAPERLPQHLVLVGWEVGRDEQLGAVLGSRYRLAKRFDPSFVGPLGPSALDLIGNPVVQVFKRL